MFHAGQTDIRNSGLLSIKFLCVTLPHMSIRARVVVAVALQQIDCAPDAEASAEGDYEGLEDLNCAIEKSHINTLPEVGAKLSRPLSILPAFLSKLFFESGRFFVVSFI